MNNIDNPNEVSEIKNQFEKLQKKYQTHLPKVDPYLVYDLLLRQQKNPATMYMYNIEVFTKQGLDTNAAKEYVYKKAGMVPSVYDKGTHYVTNQKQAPSIYISNGPRKKLLAACNVKSS
jgi:hypothetical protein